MPGDASPSRRIPPTAGDRYKIGIVGCGVISAAHLKAWSRIDGFEVAAVLDLDRALAGRRAREFGVPRVATSLEEVLETADIIDVCTPPHSHARIAEQAASAGRHIVMEKPVVTELAEWERIVDRLRGSPSKLAVIHNMKFAQSVQQARAWVDDGRIGEVIRVQREFLTSPATDRMLVGDHWSHRLPGGRWFETLPHELYITHCFAGPLELAGVMVAHTPRAPKGAPADEVMVTLRGERAFASFHFSASCEQNRRTITVQGTRGTIFVDLLSDFAAIADLGDSKLRRAAGRALLEAGRTVVAGAADRFRYGVHRLRGETPHSRIIHGFGRHLRGEGDEPTPFAEVDYVVRNCDKIGRAIDAELARLGVATRA